MVVVVALVLAAFAVRLVWIQGIAGPAIAADALASRLTTVSTLGQRGQITDANGVPLAVSVERYDVSVNQRTVAQYKGKDGVPNGAAGVAQLLAPLLGKTAAELGGTLVGDSTFRYLAKAVEPGLAREIRALAINGVMIDKVADRLYPKGTLAGNVLGFVNSNGEGLQGLEYALDDQLAGAPGSRTYERGLGGQAIPGGFAEETPAATGGSARLTLLSDVQWKAQQAADTYTAQTGASSITIVVMDARTGAVYALADSGSIDPNDPGEAGAGALSRAVSDVFEPGSTGKIVTMAAVIEEGLTTPTEHFGVPDRYETTNGAGVIKDSHDHGVLNLTTTGILAESSNVGTVMVGLRLPVETRYEYLTRFGFGELTGIEMPGESKGILRPVEQWDGRTRHNVLFGQGLSVNALQAASVYATIANGGVRVRPHMLAGWTSPDGAFTPTAPTTGEQVVSPQTAATVLTMLESAVDEGTGGLAAIAGYRVAGKTGTAQEIGTGGITASFVGVVPADDPRLVVGVFVRNPTSSIWGGSVAAPVFSEVAGFTLAELGVAPSGSAATLFPATW
jgi:cell division protein FtsI (penicillin-binding protein 3)